MNNETNYEKLKRFACNLYMTTDKNNQDIALETGVDEADLRNWISKEQWSGRKRSLFTSRSEQLELLYTRLENLNKEIRAAGETETGTKDIDNYMKLTNAIKNLETEISVSDIIEFSQPFIEWLRRIDLPAAQKTVAFIDAFIMHRIANS